MNQPIIVTEHERINIARCLATMFNDHEINIIDSQLKESYIAKFNNYPDMTRGELVSLYTIVFPDDPAHCHVIIEKDGQYIYQEQGFELWNSS